MHLLKQMIYKPVLQIKPDMWNERASRRCHYTAGKFSDLIGYINMVDGYWQIILKNPTMHEMVEL